MAKINLVVADDGLDIDLYFKIEEYYYFILDSHKHDETFAGYRSVSMMLNTKFIEEL